MLLRFTNTALLVLVIVLTLTGLWGIAFTLQGWVFDAHRIAGWAVIALIPWKTIISVRSLRRGLDFRFDRSWMIGISLLLAALALHVWRRWPRPKPADFASRRAALKLLGLAGAGAAGWLVAQSLAAA